MSYFIYKTPQGNVEVLTSRIPPGLEAGHTFVREVEEMPELGDVVFDENDQIVQRQRSYAEHRAMQYPNVTDQLDALWHAMDDGTLPKAEPFYSDILAVKQAHPKPSN